MMASAFHRRQSRQSDGRGPIRQTAESALEHEIESVALQPPRALSRPRPRSLSLRNNKYDAEKKDDEKD